MIGQFIDQLAEEGEKPNALQEAMVAFLKEELARRLEVWVDKEYEAFSNNLERLKVRLVLDGEVISSDYINV